jgi:hypothetical protein
VCFCVSYNSRSKQRLFNLNSINIFVMEKCGSSLNVFDDGAVLLRSIFWTLSSLCFATTTFWGMALPSKCGVFLEVGAESLNVTYMNFGLKVLQIKWYLPYIGSVKVFLVCVTLLFTVRCFGHCVKSEKPNMLRFVVSNIEHDVFYLLVACMLCGLFE